MTNMTASISRRKAKRLELAKIPILRRDAKAKGLPDPFEGQPEGDDALYLMSLETEEGGRAGTVVCVSFEDAARKLGGWPEATHRLASGPEIAAIRKSRCTQQ